MAARMTAKMLNPEKRSTSKSPRLTPGFEDQTTVKRKAEESDADVKRVKVEPEEAEVKPLNAEMGTQGGEHEQRQEQAQQEQMSSETVKQEPKEIPETQSMVEPVHGRQEGTDAPTAAEHLDRPQDAGRQLPADPSAEQPDEQHASTTQGDAGEPPAVEQAVDTPTAPMGALDISQVLQTIQTAGIPGYSNQ